MPEKHPNASRVGGPGASHENRREPEKSRDPGPHPSEEQSPLRSHVSGGGGEADTHHSHDPLRKGKGAPKGKFAR
jgi:hypothetical protein